MPDFSVKFIGHINEQDRSEGFPHDVVAIGSYRVENNKEIAQIIQNELMAFIQMQGMIVQIDPAQIIDTSKLNVEGRVFVPMHHISYIRTEVFNMTPMPNMIDTGEVDAKGNPIMTYETNNKDGQKAFKVLPS